MYTDKQYCEFESKFIAYIKTGALPVEFRNVEHLKSHIQENLTPEQCQYLASEYHSINPLNGMYCLVATAPIEGGAITAALAVGLRSDNMSPAWPLALGAAAGFAWCFGRFAQRMKSKRKELENYNSRFNTFDDILSKPFSKLFGPLDDAPKRAGPKGRGVKIY